MRIIYECQCGTRFDVSEDQPLQKMECPECHARIDSLAEAADQSTAKSIPFRKVGTRGAIRKQIIRWSGCLALALLTLVLFLGLLFAICKSGNSFPRG